MTVNGGSGSHSRGYDLAFALPVAVFYAFATAGNLILIERQWWTAHSWHDGLEIAQNIATLVFFAMQAILLLIRRLPTATSEGLLPRAFAVLGSNANFALLLLPRVSLEGSWATLSQFLTIVGTAASIAVLYWLGRSFSILPSARALVTRGPYRFVRHPLYLAEFVATLGIALQFAQPWAMLISLLTFTFQLKRMNSEETVLLRTYPTYAAYKRGTAKLIPGLY